MLCQLASFEALLSLEEKNIKDGHRGARSLLLKIASCLFSRITSDKPCPVEAFWRSRNGAFLGPKKKGRDAHPPQQCTCCWLWVVFDESSTAGYEPKDARNDVSFEDRSTQCLATNMVRFSLLRATLSRHNFGVHPGTYDAKRFKERCGIHPNR